MIIIKVISRDVIILLNFMIHGDRNSENEKESSEGRKEAKKKRRVRIRCHKTRALGPWLNFIELSKGPPLILGQYP